MIKRMLILGAMLLTTACTTKNSSEHADLEKGPIVITGTIKNYDKSSAKFSHREYRQFSSRHSEKVPVDKDGSFRTQFETDAPTKAFFALGSVPATYQIHVKTRSGNDSTFTRGTNDFRLVYLYLQPGDSVNMHVDVKNIKKTLSFSGDNAKNSIFVNTEENKFDSYEDKVLNNSYNIATWGPDKYKSIVNQQKKEKLQFLKDYASQHDIGNHLREVYKWGYRGDAVSSKIYYKPKHDRFTHQNVQLPADYYDFMDDASLANDFSDKGIGYFYFLDGYFTKKYELNHPESDASGQAYYQFVKDNVDGKAAYEYLAFKLGRDFNRSLYDEFDKDCPYPKLADRVKKNYEHLKGMFAGSPAPKVTLTDLNGNKKSLSDFKGQNIFLDFWATWCKPCIEQIPYIDKLKEEYKDKNIKFVSISFDRKEDVDKWKKFVRERDLSGPQFWVDSTSHTTFSKAFNIKMIPRFVLIDEQGKIVDATAPRPSETKPVHKLIDQVLADTK